MINPIQQSNINFTGKCLKPMKKNFIRQLPCLKDIKKKGNGLSDHSVKSPTVAQQKHWEDFIASVNTLEEHLSQNPLNIPKGIRLFAQTLKTGFKANMSYFSAKK